MELKVKPFQIRTGTPLVVVIHRTDAIHHDLHTTDRVEVRYKRRKVIAVVDILDHHHDPSRALIMKHGYAGLFQETAEALGVPEGAKIKILPANKPEAVKLIKKKIDGETLREPEIRRIVEDIVAGMLTDIELTSFITAATIHGLTFEEITYLTKAVATTGDRFKSKSKVVIDKHCIGGVPGNRTTMVVVPILTAFGLTMPKTSSRAITSPAGTADTMECLTNVSLSLKEMQKVVKKTNGCMVWGGAMNLAPADDKIIRIERPLSIDVTGLMLSSVMAKKYSVGATHVIIDIPYGKGAKIEKKSEALSVKEHFLTIGKLLGMKMLVVLSDGRQPVGNGIGPVLECYDVLKVLRNDDDAPQDLREKAIKIAGQMLEFAGGVKKGKGVSVARDLLESGAAYQQMEDIIEAQGRKELPDLPRYRHVVRAKKRGRVKEIHNKVLTKVSRLAGAPVTKTAGMYLYKKLKDVVKKGDPLYCVYCANKYKLDQVKEFLKSEDVMVVGR